MKGGSDIKKEELERILDISARHFRENLLSPDKECDRAYGFITKNFSDPDLLSKWEIGYAKRNGLAAYLESEGIPQHSMLQSGMVTRVSGQVVDFLQERITLPIRNKEGRVIAFAGRGRTGIQPKYVIGPETPLFDEEEIFGVFEYILEAEGIRKQKEPAQQYLAVKSLYDIIRKIKSPAEKDIWLQGIAKALNLDEQKVFDDYCYDSASKIKLTETSFDYHRFTKGRIPRTTTRVATLDEMVLGFLATNRSHRKLALETFRKEDFTRTEYWMFLQAICNSNVIDDVLPDHDDVGTVINERLVAIEQQNHKGTLFEHASRVNIVEAVKQFYERQGQPLKQYQLDNIFSMLIRGVNRDPKYFKILEERSYSRRLQDSIADIGTEKDPAKAIMRVETLLGDPELIEKSRSRIHT